MKRWRKLTAISLAAFMTASLAACSAQPAAKEAAATEAGTAETAAPAADGETYEIGVLQLIQHDALDKTNEGFVAALTEAGLNVEFDQQNASGEQSACQTIAEKFVNDGKDLIFAIATPAAQAASAATTEIPILLSAVTDPAASGLVEDNNAPGGNVSGTSDLTPVADQIDLLTKLLPEAKNVGILYCTAESNSEIQAQMAREACDAKGLAHEDYTVSSSNEIQTVVESMVGKVDVIYAPTDNVIAAGMATVSSVAGDNGIPVICGEGGMVSEGGLATYGINYFELGYMAGEQAVKILTEGADIAAMPIEYLPGEDCELQVNEEVAQQLGIDTSVLEQ